MQNRTIKILTILAILAWFIVHIPGIMYGTWQIALHQSYIGDEQSPVNGALHVISDKSLLGVRTPNLYYGPVFALVAIPGIITDYAVKSFSGIVHGSLEYRDYILKDWGGIIVQIRLLAVIVGLLGLLAVFGMFKTKTLNPKEYAWLPWLAVLFLGTNYYYFEYSHFFKHWVFILTAVLIQMLFVIKIEEEEDPQIRRRYWIIQTLAYIFGFGISYLTATFQIIWLPSLIAWLRRKDWRRYKEFGVHLVGVIAGSGLMIWWHPYAFIRILGGQAFIPLGYTDPETGLRYYSQLIFQNHIFLIAALVILAVFLWKREQLNKKFFFWSVLIFAVSNFILMAVQSRHEGRYMLPTVVCITLLGAMLLGYYWSHAARHRYLTIIICILLAAHGLLHVVHDAEWIKVYAKGPPEEAMIRQVLDYQKQSLFPVSTLLIQNYIAGHLHTRIAYQDYMKNSGKDDVNLYQQLIKTQFKRGIDPINVYYYIPPLNKIDLRLFYADPGKLPLATIGKQYNHIIIKYSPRLEPNLFDYIDEDLFRLWYEKDLNPHYIYLK